MAMAVAMTCRADAVEVDGYNRTASTSTKDKRYVKPKFDPGAANLGVGCETPCSRPWQNATPPSHRVVEHNVIPGQLDVPPAQRARGWSVLLEAEEDPFQDATTMGVDHVACAP